MKPIINKYVLLSSAMIAMGLQAFAADGNPNDASMLQVTKLNVSRNGGELTVAMDIDPKTVRPGRDREVVFTPVLRSLTSSDSIVMPNVKIAGRNRYYSHLRNGDLADGDKITLSGSGENLQYRQEFPFQPWMTRSRIVMREDVGNCCDIPEPVTTTPIAELDLEDQPLQLPYRYVALTGDSIISRKAEGRAFVNFVVNRTELKPNYMKNPEEIGKILASIKVIKDDPEAIIDRITIKGYASPEGSYSNNVRLAMGRTQTLKEYVREQYSFDPSIMATDYEPEDWQGLRDWVVEHDIPNRQGILDIIDGTLEPDPKNAELERRYPEQYKMIHRDVYPWLRHSDYTIQYSFKVFTDVEELKRIYKENPDRLRPVDFQRIAATYSPDSREYKEVYMTAVKMHPNDELANLNAANIAMEKNELSEAASYLKKAGVTPEAYYTRGVLAARTGDLKGAKTLLEQAQALGFNQADEALQTVEAEMNRPKVTYFITPVTK